MHGWRGVHSIPRFITGNWRRFQSSKASTTSLQPFHFIVERRSRRKMTKTMTVPSVNLRYENTFTLTWVPSSVWQLGGFCSDLPQSKWKSQPQSQTASQYRLAKGTKQYTDVCKIHRCVHNKISRPRSGSLSVLLPTIKITISEKITAKLWKKGKIRLKIPTKEM